MIDRRSAIHAGGFFAACTVLGGSTKMTPGKKGIGIDLSVYPSWAEILEKLKVDWFHNWGTHVPAAIPSGTEYVPMVWGRWSCKEQILKKLGELGYETLLGFNAPDQFLQANLTVEEALELWPVLMDSGMRLGSPGCVYPEDEWMTLFMKGIRKKGYRLDFITMKSFPNNNVDQFLKQIDKIYKLYKKNIWLADFCVADWEASNDRPNIYSPDEVIKFMEKAIPELEKRDYVERYAWFNAPDFRPVMRSSVLFDREGSLSTLGQLYASF